MPWLLPVEGESISTLRRVGRDEVPQEEVYTKVMLAKRKIVFDVSTYEGRPLSQA